MDIVIIGSGNVAAVLGRKFRLAGHRIIQLYGRNPVSVAALAQEWGIQYTTEKTKINPNADVYLVAVQDDAVREVVMGLQLPGKIIAHTAAAVSKDVLAPVSNYIGVFYPLQSLRKEMERLPEIPVFIDAGDEWTKGELEKLAHSISGDQVMMAGDQARLKLHVAAVMVNNFVNHLYVLAEDYCSKEGLDFRLLVPLIGETAARLTGHSPRNLQTGPAVRHDSDSIHKHLALLKEHPHLKTLYILLTESIQQNSD